MYHFIAGEFKVNRTLLAECIGYGQRLFSFKCQSSSLPAVLIIFAVQWPVQAVFLKLEHQFVRKQYC